MTADPKARLDSLDSLRGLAALAVAVAHVQMAFASHLLKADSAWAAAATWFARSGFFLVSVFFVLSGFVLARPFLLTGRADLLASAAVRRYPRIALPCLAVNLAAYLLYANGFLHNHAAAADVAGPDQWLGAMYSAPPSLAAAVKEPLWTMFFAFDGATSYNTVLWTMAAELLGSLVVFGCLGVLGRGRPLLVGGAILAAVFFLNGWFWPSLVLAGMLLAELHRHLPARLPLPAALGLAAVALYFAGHIAVHKARMPLTGYVYPHNYLFRAAAAIGLVAAVVFSPRLDRLLSARPLDFLGKISFGLYLSHVLLLVTVGCHLYLTLRAAGWSYPHATVGTAAAFLPLSLVVGWLTYLFVDRPAVWLSRAVYVAGFRPRPAGGIILQLPPTVKAA